MLLTVNITYNEDILSWFVISEIEVCSICEIIASILTLKPSVSIIVLDKETR